MMGTSVHRGVREAARRYAREGFTPIPIPKGFKKPIQREWQLQPRLAEAQVDTLFDEHSNIGLLLGQAGNDLIDVDLDVPEAVTLGAALLPPTNRIHGRPGNPRSHYWYRASPPPKSKPWRYVPSAKTDTSITEEAEGAESLEGAPAEAHKGMIAEIRSDGRQTLVPPSLHPSSEVLAWERDGEPAVVSGEELIQVVSRVAAGALLARHWPATGNRDVAAMALCGMLVSAGWSPDDVDEYVRLIARAAGDEEWTQRGKAARSAEQLRSGNPVTGIPTLTSLLVDGDAVVAKVCEWLEISNRQRQARSLKPVQWEEPEPLPEGAPSVQPLDPELLPDPLRGWLVDIAERMQTPLEFASVGAIVASASLVGRRLGIRPKRNDTWLVVPNLWGAIVGLPASMKTPAIDEALKPLNALMDSARQTYDNDVAEFEVEALEAEALRDELKTRLKNAARNRDKENAAASAVANLKEELRKRNPPKRPTLRRYTVTDATVEKLGELLIENPQGLLLHRDELAGWLHQLEKFGREGDRAFYLEAWNGQGRFEVDRIGRGSLVIPALCLSIVGGIQPGPLESYVFDTTSAGARNDGLLQRFQLLVWPDKPTKWKNVDRSPNQEAQACAYSAIRGLDSLLPSAFAPPTTSSSNSQEIPFLQFTPSAQAVFDKWREQLENRLLSEDLPECVEAHLGKYRSLMPSLALIFHLLEVVVRHPDNQGYTDEDRSVSESAAVRACAWCAYLETHAMRVYGVAVARAQESALALRRHIVNGDIQDNTPRRDVYRRNWKRLTTREDVDAAIDLLVEYGWIRVDKLDTGGRPSEVIRVNPKVRARTSPSQPTSPREAITAMAAVS